MPTSRFEPSSIKNKAKREEVARKIRKVKCQQKLQKRLQQAKLEANDPAIKKVGHLRLAYNRLLSQKMHWVETFGRKCSSYTG